MENNEHLRLLVVGGHPADVFDHCGGTMAHHIQAGDSVTCLALTQGLRVHDKVLVEKARSGELDMNSDLDALIKEREQVKRQEVYDACAIFGIKDVRFLSYNDKVLLESDEMIDAVARVIREVKPHILITHYPYVGGGFGQHAKTAQITIQASGLAGTFDFDDSNPPWRVARTFFMIPGFQELTYSMLSAAFCPYIPMYVDITDQVENKVRALECMKSQQYEGLFARKRTEVCEGMFGHHNAVGYAEAFVPSGPDIWDKLYISPMKMERHNEPELTTRNRGSYMRAPFVE